MNYTQKSKLIDRLCGVGLMLICIEIFYSIVNSAYTKYNYDLREVTTWVNVAGGIVLAIGIAILIYSYIKKKGNTAFYGGELVVLAFTAVTLPGSYIDFVFPFNKLNIVYPIAFAVYYFGKAIYVVRDVSKNNNKKPSKKKASKKKNKR